MTKADPDDEVIAEDSPQDETAQAGVGGKVGGPLGVILGLGVAAATGVFLTEDGPPGEGAQRPVAEEIAPTSAGGDGTVETAQLGAAPRPGGMPPLPPEIVVAFKDKSMVKPICDLYWKDKDAARAAFQRFASDKPYLDGLRLKSVNYSNDLILELADPPAPQGSQELRAQYGVVTKALRASPDVKYAEPNSTAQPGKDKS